MNIARVRDPQSMPETNGFQAIGGAVAERGMKTMYTLNEEDGRAVDMLLDVTGPSGERIPGNGGSHQAMPAKKPSGNGNGNGHGNGHAQPAAGAFSTAHSSFSERLMRVGQILDLVGEMPASDPPADLLAKTLTRIENAPAVRRPTPPNDRPNLPPQRPQA